MVKKVNQKGKTSKAKLIGLALAAIAVFGGGILFVGAAAGWFNQPAPAKITLDAEYLGNFEVRPLSIETFNNLIRDKKSFVVISYLPGCTAKMLSLASRFAEENQITIYYMNFSDLRNTTLHDKIKYSPTVAVISKGELVDFLDSNSNEDTKKYNDYDAFSAWLQGKIDFSARK